MKKNWIKQLSESYIQMNEVKANIRGQYPFLKHGPNSDQDPSVRAGLAREDLDVAASMALTDPSHWVHAPQFSAIKTALTNHVGKNTQKEDLEHLVRFKQMDPQYIQFTIQQAFDE